MKKILSTLIVVALVAVFCVSAFMVGKYFVDSKKSSDKYDELQEMVSKPQTEPAETTPEATEKAPEKTEDGEEKKPLPKPKHYEVLPEYQDVYLRNGDMVGWIKIEGTKVNYPVMQTKERPNYYLKRDFDGNASDWGSLYIREECDVNTPSDNVTIYGHNMIDGSMFGDLKNYGNKTFWESHKEIFFDTLNEYHVYEIFAVFKTSANEGEGFAYHQMEDAANEKEFNDFIATAKKLSFYDTGITPVYGDKLICLSTCEYTLDNGRFVVAARRIA